MSIQFHTVLVRPLQCILPARLPAALVIVICILFPARVMANGSGTGLSEAYKRTFGQEFSRLLATIPQTRIDNVPKTKALKGLELIGQYRLEEGSALLNSALQLDPSNSYLQFFNAFAYQMMAQRGDTQKYNLAEQGYALAIQFDRSNWIAHYFMGVLHFEQRNYRAAQSDFAEVLLFREDDTEVLSRMVAASYYSGDAVTAAACLNRLNVLDPKDAQVLRMLAVIHAALGHTEEAQRWLSQYQTTHPESIELVNTRERIAHWSVVYQNSKPLAAVDPLEERAAPQFDLGYSILNRPPVKDGHLMKVGFPPIDSYSDSGPANSAQTKQKPINESALSDRMVLVDVVLMYITDTLSTSNGVNLLNALTMQFGDAATAGPAFSKTFSSTNTNGVVSATTALTRAISIPALTYSLNIVNSNSNLNEVLARPTLAALDGMTSEFFSGETLNAAVVSSGANSGGAVQIEKEIGVKLSIKPTFQPTGKIRLKVDAERTFLKPPSADVAFTYKIAVTKVMINANVEMSFGETLVLGGLSEKETTKMRDGVPLLQDIPGVQYLFSNKKSNDYQHSVLMLITPRLPQYTYRPEEVSHTGTEDGKETESFKEFRARYGDWFAPYPNMASVFNQLNSSSIYREFRTGDVTLEKWDRQATTLQRLQQALGFLYF